MSVDVAAGRGLYQITNTNLTPSKTYKVYHDSDAVENVAISAADATNPRIDIIVMKCDVTQNPDAASGNIPSIIVVTGTPAVSPSAPATPSNCLKLAQIAVAAGATSIVTGNITDSRTYVDMSTAVLLSLLRRADAQKDAPVWLGTITGTNTLTGTADPVPSSYVAGMRFEFIAANNNTGSVSLNVNGLGAKTIKKLDGATNLAANEIVAGQIVVVKYDGTNLQMLTPPATTSLTSQAVRTYALIADSNTVSNTTAETDFNKTITLAANSLQAGDTVEFYIAGENANAGSSNIQINLKFGSTVLLDFPTVDFTTTDTVTWECYGTMTVRTTGSGGTMKINGSVKGSSTASSGTKVPQFVKGSTSSIDTTIANVVTPSTQMGTANAGNTSKMTMLIVRVTPATSTVS